jgi:hypothetical protein
MLVGFARYSRDRSFTVLRRHGGFVLALAVGSVAGAFIGGQMLGIVPSFVLLPVLAAAMSSPPPIIRFRRGSPKGRLCLTLFPSVSTPCQSGVNGVGITPNADPVAAAKSRARRRRLADQVPDHEADGGCR